MTFGQHPFLEKALQNLRAAHLLLEEKLYDAAANRAYFAAHHAARAALSAKGYSVEAKKVHEAVQATFAGELVERRKVYPGKQGTLLNLMTLRHKADYEEVGVSSKQARRGVRKADAFVSAIQEELE